MDEAFLEKSAVSEQEKNFSLKPHVKDPREIFELFRSSEGYKREERNFFEGKKFDLLVTPAEKQETLESSSVNIEQQLANFISDDIIFTYDASYLKGIRLDDGSITDEPFDRVKAYLEFRQKIKDGNNVRQGSTVQNQDYIEAQDMKRRLLHNRAADTLVQYGFAPNQKLGRILIEAIAGGLKSKGQKRNPTEFETIVRRLGGRA
jgi:hypothetical protein